MPGVSGSGTAAAGRRPRTGPKAGPAAAAAPPAHRIVVDDEGRRYPVGRELGSGGQGSVYEVPGRRLAAKLLRPSARSRERVEAQVREVRRLDLDGLPIARPVALLSPPHVGYVMELMDGMHPLRKLIPGLGVAGTLDGYLEGGGLRRRLRLLARYASILARLHGRGLVYGDPSAENVFVSRSPSYDEVQLIDADNLRYWSAPDPGYIHTPLFGAPELVARRSGVNTLTDAYAFAVTAFWVLRGVHPFLGDEVSAGDPEELEAHALAGELPWVDDPGDRRNQTTQGLPLDLVFSARLAELAARTFGPGRTDPALRPGVGEWAERLYAAADAALECEACRSTYFFNRGACPWCDAPAPAFLLAHLYVFDPQAGPEGLGNRKDTRVGLRAISRDVPARLEGRDFASWGAADADQPRLELFWDGTELSIHALDDRTYRMRAADGSREERVGESGFRFAVPAGGERWRLHLGPPDRVHRVLSFELRRPR